MIKMRIALVWPKGFDIEYVMPLPYGYLKSNLDEAKHIVQIFDCSLKSIRADSPEFRKLLEEFKPDVVGVSCWSPTYEEGIRVLQVAKSINPKIVTVIGGAHASSYPDAIMKNDVVDYLFDGESELSFPVFLEELENQQPDWSKVKGLVYRSVDGTTLVKNNSEREENMDIIKIPDYDAMNLLGYIKSGYRFNTTVKDNAPVWVTRGCPYRCQYCAAPQLNGRLIRAHSVEYMVNMVKFLYNERGIRQINIIDDNFTFDMKYAKEFCRAMIDLNLKDLHFGTPNGIRIQRTDFELLQLMKTAGWENVVVAPESGSVSTLQRMKKDLDPAIIKPKVEEIRKAGLKVHGFFIIGYPGDTISDIKDTIKMLRECRFNFFFLNNFQPLPGTPIYDELVNKGEIADGLLPKNYSGGERVYVPQGLKEFNFAKFVLKEYVHLMVTEPLNIPYVIKLISPKMIVKKVFSNIKNTILPPQIPSQGISEQVMVSEAS